MALLSGPVFLLNCLVSPRAALLPLHIPLLPLFYQVLPQATGPLLDLVATEAPPTTTPTAN